MMLGWITAVEEQPVINPSVAAHAPGNRFVRIRAVMPVIPVQITKTMAEIPERQEEQNESPVDEVNRIRWYDGRHHQKRRGECRQFNVAPEIVAVAPFPQVLANRPDIVAEGTQKNVAPRIFLFAIVAVSVDR